MLKKSLIIFSISFFLVLNLIIGYTLYNLLSNKSLTNVRDESIEVINIIKEATDEISSGMPVRNKRGTISSDDYNFILDYYSKYEQLLSEDFSPEENGYTKSEKNLVNYVINLFVSYGLMNEQFIFGDIPFASFMMEDLYKEIDKVPIYLYLESQNELSNIGIEYTEYTEYTEEIKLSQINNLDENEFQETEPPYGGESKEQSHPVFLEQHDTDSNTVDENQVEGNFPQVNAIKTIDDGVNTLFGILNKQECTQNDDQKVECYILKLSAPINIVPSRDVLEELVFDRRYLNNITEVELDEDNRLQNYINKQVTVKGQIIVAQNGGWHRYVGLSVIDINLSTVQIEN